MRGKVGRSQCRASRAAFGHSLYWQFPVCIEMKQYKCIKFLRWTVPISVQNVSKIAKIKSRTNCDRVIYIATNRIRLRV